MSMNLLDRELVVVRQKAKLIELTNQYFLQDAEGNEIGWIVEEGQNWLRKLLRLVSRLDSLLSHRLGVADASGARVLNLHKPGSFFRSRVEVSDAVGTPVGVIRQQNVFGKVRFSLEGAAGEPLGELRAENWRAWDFQITDASGAEVARVTKKWAGLLREGFTTADTYVFTVSPTVTGPLRMLCFAAAAAVDTALKQNDH
jgi:uncharacterized protein YxjI